MKSATKVSDIYANPDKFNEAVSLMIPVETQAEVERLSNALSAVPEAEQCGWVYDHGDTARGVF